MPDSDSSEDDNLQNLLEAVDTDLISDNLYKNDKTTTKESSSPEQPKSIRKTLSEEDTDSNLLKLTPGVQQYVAKQLENFLEQSLAQQLVNKPDITKKRKRTKNKIKLLSDSLHYIDPNYVENEDYIQKKLPTKSEFDSEDENKIKSVLVTTEDILSKKEVSNWAKSTRTKKIFRYKEIKIKNSTKRAEFKKKGKKRLEEIPHNFEVIKQ